MSLEPEFRDATNMEPEEDKGYITSRIVIRHILTPEGGEIVDADWPDGASMLELLGMLDYARTILWEGYHALSAENDEEED